VIAGALLLAVDECGLLLLAIDECGVRNAGERA
jgi:hypothetical protein